MKKIIIIILLISISFTIYSGHQSQSFTTITEPKVGDRLVTDQELYQILATAKLEAMNVSIRDEDQAYGVTIRGKHHVITDEAGLIYYRSLDPIQLLASVDDQWLIAQETDEGPRLIAFQPNQSKMAEIAFLKGQKLGDVFEWQGQVYVEASSASGHQIYRYRPSQAIWEVFIENGFEPKIYHGRLYYLYEKGDQLGFESVNSTGNDIRTFAPAYGDIYSYFFRDEQVDLLSISTQLDQRYFLRIQDAFGNSTTEQFGYFDARFQTERIVFGTNGSHDSLLVAETLIQIPKQLHFQTILQDRVYFEFNQQAYSIAISDLEAIFNRQQ